MKEEYEKLCEKIKVAGRKTTPCDLVGDFEEFSGTDRRNHSSIIKVITNENEYGDPDGIPHLIYVSREKRPNHPHHSKAGGMNVLMRVSGILTNAPFMLNVDCDMYANNPHIMLHSLCLFVGAKSKSDSAFVQYPQLFYNGVKNDPFRNQLVVLLEVQITSLSLLPLNYNHATFLMFSGVL
ncbi:hypothetical protein MLD38_025792 [Melastoma candidum]|uniref:Uncharacterized protein n=1 Tax=Melastoma candidum TaxID=119954 RepID=A0ACB9P3E1_9MYRT|nr:hypothetical protein MLD38_025792 [Melastoma candidum]